MPPARRTQQQRRAETTDRLLDAAIDSLLEQGYAATSITGIQERSGLGRGTVQHYFPTKAELVVAATARLVEQRLERTRAAAAELDPAVDRVDALVDLVWQDLNSPPFLAALELWVAARTDDELRAALLPHERRLMSATAALFVSVLEPERGTDPRTATFVEFTIDVLTGLVMTTLLTGNLGDRGRLVERWKQALHTLFEHDGDPAGT